MAKIGLLGFYVELYDEKSPHMREKIDVFYKNIANEFSKLNIEVSQHSICRVEKEFRNAVLYFESLHVDALVTLHLAYSPSLESIEVLKSTKLPIIILNTTPDYELISTHEYNAISYNHAIHGVQDMCNLLVRNGTNFIIETGHWKKSNILKRIARKIKIVEAVNLSQNIKVGLIGNPFKGMGDFAIDFGILDNKLGIKTIKYDREQMYKNCQEIKIEEITEEIQINAAKFDVSNIKKKDYYSNIRTSLAIRKWIKENSLDAFTFNFYDIDKKSGLSTIPFYEASNQLSESKGYAGEGDVLTAAFISLLAKAFPKVSFVETFCPDWKENLIFISHMGEINTKLCEDKPILYQKQYSFSEVEVNPIMFSGEYMKGNALLANLAPSFGNTFSMIVTPVKMVHNKKIANGIRGWFKPEINISDFLSRYSILGGTHHCALIYGAQIEDLKFMAGLMGFDFKTIGKDRAN